MTGEIDLNEEYQTKHDTYFIQPCKQRGHHSAHLVHGGRKSHQPCLFLWWKIEGQKSFYVIFQLHIQLNLLFKYPINPFPTFLPFFAFMKSIMLHITVLINSSAFENAVITDAPEW